MINTTEIMPLAIAGFVIVVPIALAIVIVSNKRSAAARAARLMRCPYCAEMIQRLAIVCRFCGRDLPK